MFKIEKCVKIEKSGRGRPGRGNGFEMLNYFISSCSAQVTISQEVAKWLKNLPKVKILKFHFLKLEYYHFWCTNFEMNLTK